MQWEEKNELVPQLVKILNTWEHKEKQVQLGNSTFLFMYPFDIRSDYIMEYLFIDVENKES